MSNKKDKIAIIGTGLMGHVLSLRLAAAGYTVVLGSRDPSRADVQELARKLGDNGSATTQREAVRGTDIVMLAVPWHSTEETLQALGDLSGKIVVEMSGPDRVADDGYLEPDIPESLLPMSGAEVVQTWIPDAHVVKTLTTVSYFIIGDPLTVDGPVTVPVAANEKMVRTRIIEILKEIGLDAVDVGVLRMAREIEGMTRLYMIPMQRRELDCTWEFYFKRVSGWTGTYLDDFFPKLDD